MDRSHEIEQEAGDLVVVAVERQPGHRGAAALQAARPLQQQGRLAEAGRRRDDRELAEGLGIELPEQPRALDRLAPLRRDPDLRPDEVKSVHRTSEQLGMVLPAGRPVLWRYITG